MRQTDGRTAGGGDGQTNGRKATETIHRDTETLEATLRGRRERERGEGGGGREREQGKGGREKRRRGQG